MIECDDCKEKFNICNLSRTPSDPNAQIFFVEEDEAFRCKACFQIWEEKTHGGTAS